MPASRPHDLDSSAFERITARFNELMAPFRLQEQSILTPIPGMTLLRHLAPTTAEATIYRPVVCLILQGAKETVFSGETSRVRRGQALLVSHDIPIVARVLRAPYSALIFELDLGMLRGLYEDVGDEVLGSTDGRSLRVCEASAAWVGPLARYLDLHDAPMDVRVLGAALRREIHYRLLLAPFGAMLRNLLRHDSHASAIARAIATLRRDLRAPMVVTELARGVGMSVSSFHKHFRELTSSSPLQYQKDLRLLEAQRRLLMGTESVTSVAFEVGYWSPSQFSREYARKFGHPPSRERRATSSAREG
ncbi:MAG: AraC family transcriptional regulator [Polyangiaceae bacterium]|jgi:AraC-like DNA-binding protein|nr:AraC family transcriptional regulator [Polyangiaceae bacterium]